jgi:hypothetical protein
MGDCCRGTGHPNTDGTRYPEGIDPTRFDGLSKDLAMIRLKYLSLAAGGKKSLAVILMVAFCLGRDGTRAEEGMYPISQLGSLDLRSKGLELTADQIFNPQATCLLDGICRVNGCTGSFVSSQGLIITNHHCAFGAIQSASTPTQDLLSEGFHAPSREQEIPARGYTVRITEAYRDVSDQVLGAVTDRMNPLERAKAIERRRKEIEKEAEATAGGMRAEVAEMFSGKTYLLFLYTYLKDVRLVFAPPASIGNFGGEVDNWEWPRHTGDFSLMRAYVAPDGSSADYSPSNVPYQPKRSIRVQAQGVDEGDAVFLLGYPGRTARHKTASYMQYESQVRLPYIVDLYAWQMATMEETGKSDRGVAIQHASHLRNLGNVEKRARGQLKGLSRTGLVAKRMAEENELRSFIASSPDRKAQFATVLDEIDQVYQAMTQAAPIELPWDHLVLASRTLNIAFTLFDAASERAKPDLDREPNYMDRNFDQTVKGLMLQVEDLHLPTDTIVLQGMLQRLQSVASGMSGNHPFRSWLATVGQTASPDLERIAKAVLSSTHLKDKTFVEKCLSMKPGELAASGDGALAMVAAFYPEYVRLRQLNKERTGQLDKAYAQLIDVKQQFLSKRFVPDANATLRLTIGRVQGYSPEPGLIRTPITTLRGVMEKTTGVDPFITPDIVQRKYRAREFGPYVHPRLQQVPVAILYSTDTTGGNSGSPVLNARGELVGVNFDRAFEATINDFAWDAGYSRSIGVDIRYCLWLIGTVYGGQGLVGEMLRP